MVPSKKIQDPKEKVQEDMHAMMSDILKDGKLSTYEKLQLYNDIYVRFKVNYKEDAIQPSEITQIQVPDNNIKKEELSSSDMLDYVARIAKGFNPNYYSLGDYSILDKTNMNETVMQQDENDDEHEPATPNARKSLEFQNDIPSGVNGTRGEMSKSARKKANRKQKETQNLSTILEQNVYTHPADSTANTHHTRGVSANDSNSSILQTGITPSSKKKKNNNKQGGSGLPRWLTKNFF